MKLKETGQKREAFPFYWSFKDAILELDDSEKLAIYEAITDYAFMEKEPQHLSPIGKLAWKLIRPNLDASMHRYETCRINGAKGGNPNFKKGKPNPYYCPKDNQKDNLKEEIDMNKNMDNKKENTNRIKCPATFVPPSLKDIRVYCKERDYSINAEQFYDFYESKGWYVGQNKMKNWHAAVANWFRRDAASKKMSHINSVKSNNLEVRLLNN